MGFVDFASPKSPPYTGELKNFEVVATPPPDIVGSTGKSIHPRLYPQEHRGWGEPKLEADEDGRK